MKRNDIWRSTAVMAYFAITQLVKKAAVRRPLSAGHPRTGASQLRDNWHLRVRLTSYYVPIGGVQPPRSCCAPCFAMHWTCLTRHTSISPIEVMGSGGRLLSYDFRCIRHPTTGYSGPTSESNTPLRTLRPTVSGRPRRRV